MKYRQIAIGGLYEPVFPCLHPVPIDGSYRQHPLLYQLSQRDSAPQAEGSDYQRTLDRSCHHHLLQLPRQRSHAVSQYPQRYDSNCRGHHLILALPQDDLPPSARRNRQDAPRYGAFHRSFSSPFSGRSGSTRRRHDLFARRAKSACHGRRHFDCLGSFADHSPLCTAPTEKVGLERDYSHGKADGTDPNFNFRRDVHERDQRISFKATLTYDGTHYFGWQKTKSGPSIQETIEQAIHSITQERGIVEAASRTDRGVHARGQVIQFTLEKKWDLFVLQKALNARLPPDIRLIELSYCSFHPTLDCLGKEYRYHLTLGPVQEPTKRLYAWHIPYLLDRNAILEASGYLIGKQDFSALANEPKDNPICHLETIQFKNDTFVFRGDRFLYKMVRNLVGLLIQVGRKKILPSQIPSILASRDRKQSAMTAPAHGLYLHQVFYRVE